MCCHHCKGVVAIVTSLREGRKEGRNERRKEGRKDVAKGERARGRIEE